MKRKRLIPLILTVALTCSVWAYTAPTWGEPIAGMEEDSSESGDFSAIENESENENSSSVEGDRIAENILTTGNEEAYADLTLMEDSGSEDNSISIPASSSNIEEEPSGYPDFSITNKAQFLRQFKRVLKTVEVPDHLDFTMYYSDKNPFNPAVGLPEGNPSILLIANAIKDAGIANDLVDDPADLINYIQGSLIDVGMGMSEPTIYFTVFENGEKFAYSIFPKYKDDGSTDYYLIPVKGRELDNFHFSVIGHMDSFNLPRDKEICKGNMQTIIRFIKENYPGIADVRFTNRRIQYDVINGVKEYYYPVEYTDTDGNKKQNKVYVGDHRNFIRRSDATRSMIEAALKLEFPEGRFKDNQHLTDEEVTLLEKKFDRIKNNALTRVLSVKVNPELVPYEAPYPYSGLYTDEELDREYGIELEVTTEDTKVQDAPKFYTITLPIYYSRELKLISLFPVDKDDLRKYALSKDKEYIYIPSENDSNAITLESYLKSKLNDGELLGNPDIVDVNKVYYKKEIHYPVLAEDGSLIRTLKINLKDNGFLGLRDDYAKPFYLKGHDIQSNQLMDEPKEELEKLFRERYGEAFQSIESIADTTVWGRAVITLNLHDGTQKEVYVEILRNAGCEDTRPGHKEPVYNLSYNYSCFNGCKGTDEPTEPEKPVNPEEPAQPENPATPINPGRGNSGGSGSNGGSRTPDSGENRTPVVLSGNRESTPSSVNPEVLGEAREMRSEETKPIPEVLGAERKGRGHVKTMDETHAFPLYFSVLSAIALVFWALQDKKKSKTGNTL